MNYRTSILHCGLVVAMWKYERARELAGRRGSAVLEKAVVRRGDQVLASIYRIRRAMAA